MIWPAIGMQSSASLSAIAVPIRTASLASCVAIAVMKAFTVVRAICVHTSGSLKSLFRKASLRRFVSSVTIEAARGSAAFWISESVSDAPATMRSMVSP